MDEGVSELLTGLLSAHTVGLTTQHLVDYFRGKQNKCLNFYKSFSHILVTTKPDLSISKIGQMEDESTKPKLSPGGFEDACGNRSEF